MRLPVLRGSDRDKTMVFDCRDFKVLSGQIDLKRIEIQPSWEDSRDGANL